MGRLVGPYPAQADVYQERSPIRFVDRVACPVILLQGLDDRVVPPDQAELMFDALRRRGVPVAYLAFEGEGHGFRKSEHIRRSLEAELSFYGRVLGLEPADELPPLQIENM
jgi:dipeptidyl aminopeptidase/acylaminoacyl peptidase